MKIFAARFYDGKSSQAHPVSIYRNTANCCRLVGRGIDLSYALADIRPSPRIGNTRRYLYLPDGSQCETDDNDAIDALFSSYPSHKTSALLHRWESRLAYVLAAFLFTTASVWASITYGIPALAHYIAFTMPADTQKLLSQEGLSALDKFVFEPTTLPTARQQEIQALFSTMTASIAGTANYRLELRSSEAVGANAFALPNGVIVMTDGLVTLAQHNNELIAVLAHEMGHLQERHSLRQLLQDSVTMLIIIAITGDMSAVTSLSAAIPTLLVQSKYSRDFEREADTFAFNYLRQHSIPTHSLMSLLQRIEDEEDEKDKGDKDSAIRKIFNYLSTHPMTEERNALN